MADIHYDYTTVTCPKCGAYRYRNRPECNCTPFKVWSPDMDGEDLDGARTLHAVDAEEAAIKYLKRWNEDGDGLTESAEVLVNGGSITQKYHVSAQLDVRYSATREKSDE